MIFLLVTLRELLSVNHWTVILVDYTGCKEHTNLHTKAHSDLTASL